MYQSPPAFEWDKISDFITCGNTYGLAHFEFAFEVANASGTTYMIRKKHFESEYELANYYSSLHRVLAVHVGGMRRDDEILGPLRFDVDVTDWADCCSCNCSQNKTVCAHCWCFANLAMYCLHETLRKDFGFKDITTFYSGRRGFHMYIRDEQVYAMTGEERCHIRDMLKYDPASPTLLACMHRCLPTMRTFFAQHIKPHHEPMAQIDETVDRQLLSVCWPRVDPNPLTQPAHLLRCPYTKHGATGRLVHPIEADEFLVFSPFPSPP